MSFDAFCRQHLVTPAERTDLAWHLAFLRMRRMVIVLGLAPKEGAP